MRPILAVLLLADALQTAVRDHVRRVRAVWKERPEGGYASETVIVTALLVAAAIVVVGVIVGKVTAKAKSIDLGP